MRKSDKQTLKQLNKARKFGVNTCPASRHVHMIVEQLLDPKSGLYKAIDKAGYEPDHMGGSIASVLEGLWEARGWMKWEKLPPTGKLKYNGHWVPDLEAIARLTQPVPRNEKGDK